MHLLIILMTAVHVCSLFIAMEHVNNIKNYQLSTTACHLKSIVFHKRLGNIYALNILTIHVYIKCITELRTGPRYGITKDTTTKNYLPYCYVDLHVRNLEMLAN